VTAGQQSEVAALRRCLSAHPQVRLALLFGSTARGDAGPESDLDVAVLAPGADALGLAAALRDATGRDVDVVSLEEPTIPLLEELVRDAIVLHEGSRGAAAQWRAAALLALETDLPWYRRMRDGFVARLAAMSEAGDARG
jgi:predicted nucleotidyltransferase